MIGMVRVGAGVLVLGLLAGCTGPGGSISLGGATTGSKAGSKADAKSGSKSGSRSGGRSGSKSGSKSDDKSGSKAGSTKAPGKPGKPGSALTALAGIDVKGRAPKTGYDRDQFGPAWKDVDRNGCDTRNDILRRDLTQIAVRPKTHDCVIVSGTLADRYTGQTIAFRKAGASEVQIDHVVALENAWVTGAFAWSEAKRTQLANDPLNLLAVDGSTNESKGSGDAATWLPPRKSYRCAYVARQVAVKKKYGNWMTKAEHRRISDILESCRGQRLPG